MLDPNGPEGHLFAQFDKSLRQKHAERLRGYKPQSEPLAKRKEEKKGQPCAACADGLCPEHDGDKASALEQLLASEG